MPHLVIMAAGTGGHIMPGLAVAREMRRRGWTVSWLGTTTGMENTLVPREQIPMDLLGFSGLRGKGVLHALSGGARLLKAFWDAARALRRRSADVVLGMGGYVCFPGGMMASLLGKPLMLMNADASLLLSNRALLPVADRVAFGFEGRASQGLKGAVVSGNPVRAEIEQIEEPAPRMADRTGPLRVLVVGGSLGARVLNETLPRAWALLPAQQRPHVLHQTGRDKEGAVRQAYLEAFQEAYQETHQAGVPQAPGVEVRAFIEDMATELARCDLVICRAGAITVSEVCAAGVASMLVPLVASTTAHQRDNAQWLSERGAAIHLPQEQLTPQRLAQELQALDRSRLTAMAVQARALARHGAAARVADEIERLCAA